MKMIGSVLILLSSILCSFYYEKRLKNRISKCEELISFISYIKSQIEYFSYPIDVIYDKYEQKTEFIMEIISGQTISDKIFDAYTRKNISNFFSQIGKGFKKEQITLCSFLIEELSNQLLKYKSDYPSNVKVFRSMSLFFGISTIILLI